MTVRGLDVNYDWQFGRGLSNYKTGLDAIRQSIMTRLKSWKSDCFFALDDGVDYENFLDRNTKVFLDNDIKRIILQSYGVIKITTFESEIGDDRDYTASTQIETVYGVITLEV